MTLDFLFGDIPKHQSASYGIYISQLFRYANAWTSVLDFCSITPKLLTQVYIYQNTNTLSR